MYICLGQNNIRQSLETIVMDEFMGMIEHVDSLDVRELTPEELGIKLLVDPSIRDYEGVVVGLGANGTRDELAMGFEILVTVYMEMIFGVLRMSHINQLDSPDAPEIVDEFAPDFTNISIDDMTGVFREKLKKLRIFLSVLPTEPNDSGYYCRVILRDTPKGREHFDANPHQIDPKKRYTFVIRNDMEQKQRVLKDFYAICCLPTMVVRISFDPINVRAHG